MPGVMILLGVGVVTGVLAGMLGAGGGFATIVLLIAAGVDVHDAVGTSLLYTVVVGAWGAAVHLRRGSISVWLAVALGIPSMATAVLGATIADSLDERVLTGAFGALTIGVALLFVWGPGGKRGAGDPPPIAGAQVARPPRITPRPTLVAGAVSGGAAIGVMKGLFGVGGGFLLVPFMVLVLSIPEHVAVGSSLLAIMVGSIAGGLRHLALGNVDTSLLVYLIPAGVIGSLAGALIVERMSARSIRRTFAVVLVASAGYLVWHSVAA